MMTNPIVKRLDIFKDDLSRLLTRGEAVMMQTFRLQRTKEAFHRRIVPAISLPTHRRLHAIADL